MKNPKEGKSVQTSLVFKSDLSFKKASSLPDDEKEFRVSLAQLQEVWGTRSGVKGREFHLWFKRYKADVILRHVLKPVRKKSSFVDKHFTTHRVECVNSMVSDETDHQQHQLHEFVVKMRQLSERQRRNVQWAVFK